MTITIIGAGHIGSAIAAGLAARDEVDVVKICDSHTRSLQSLHDTIESPKLRSFQVDARDIGTLDSIMAGSDCVVASTSPQLNPALAAKCLELGSHFCDLGGLPDIMEQHVALRADAEERGLWVVPNCGLDPGLVNVLCMTALKRFDAPVSASIRVGDVPLDPEPPFNFRLAWSPEKLLDDYTNPVPTLEDGRLTDVAPLSRVEQIRFDEPFGEMEAFATSGTIRPLVEAAGDSLRSLDHKTIRWPGHVGQMQFALGLGLAESRSIDVRTHLTYRDVFARLLRKHLGGDFSDAVLCRVSVSGLIDGEKKTLVFQLVSRYDDETGMTAMRRCTSLPVVVTAIMLASGEIAGGGVQPPECMLPGDAFIDHLRSHGLDIRESVYDGVVPVNEPALEG